MIGTNLLCAGAVAAMLLGTAPGRYWVLYAALVARTRARPLRPAGRLGAGDVGTGLLLNSANGLNAVSSGRSG